MKLTDHVAIVTHEHLPGASHNLRDYLSKRGVSRVTFISHPLVNRSGNSYKERYQNGRWIDQKRVARVWIHSLISYPIDCFITLRWLFTESRIDWYIGVGPLNAIVGVVLKRIKKARHVVFYSIDFTPRRFSNGFLNVLYHIIEKWSVRYTDMCWDVSPRIQEGRMQFLGLPEYKRVVVPIGVEERHIAKINGKRHPFRIGFVGHLLEKQGVQLILEALSKIASVFPRVELLVIGGGEYKKTLESRTKKLHIAKRVLFTDWISDQDEVARRLSTCVLGFAPYILEGASETNFTYWADPTKIKTYLAAGLPVILTDVPYNARELEEKSCAVVIPYNADELAKRVIDLLSDSKKLHDMRGRALSYARTVTWDEIFKKATSI